LKALLLLDAEEDFALLPDLPDLAETPDWADLRRKVEEALLVAVFSVRPEMPETRRCAFETASVSASLLLLSDCEDG
jgi:hypothetical protein